MVRSRGLCLVRSRGLCLHGPQSRAVLALAAVAGSAASAAEGAARSRGRRQHTAAGHATGAPRAETGKRCSPREKTMVETNEEGMPVKSTTQNTWKSFDS
jgi:hypothetical protein